VRIENSFQVDAPVEDAWALLMDVPRIVPCMPGAQLTETVDDDHWKAKMAVKLGPISLNFDTNIARETVDEAAHRAVLAADARESKGRGSATATIESSLAAQNGGTRVDLVTELALTGPVAQYGRGLVQSVASQLTATFAGCLEKQLAPAPAADGAGEAAATPEGSAPAPPPPPPAPPQPHAVSGLRLGLNALLDVLHLRHHHADADR
jgi:carbon monoxide dehydrogenase subunit G